MSYELQRKIQNEVNARFPADRDNLGQQLFRSSYTITRQAGRPDDEAYRKALISVRQSAPEFTPVET